MSDTTIPTTVMDWMKGLNWGSHHDEWHYTRRFYYWPALLQATNDPAARAELQEMIDYATTQGWQAALYQEGAPGSGLDFLAMHRAMLILLVKNHPESVHWFRGWETPPLDPADALDPVANATAFDEGKARGIGVIEDQPATFATDDDFGRFLETPIRPTVDNPANRDPNPELGLHNYLHNRWTDDTSAVNLGDPKVNIFNARFWRLHGWIDYQWWHFRRAKQANDADATYQALIQHYLHMMGHAMPHGGHLMHVAGAGAALPRPRGFSHIFSF